MDGEERGVVVVAAVAGVCAGFGCFKVVSGFLFLCIYFMKLSLVGVVILLLYRRVCLRVLDLRDDIADGLL